jgi:hypothetical protein
MNKRNKTYFAWFAFPSTAPLPAGGTTVSCEHPGRNGYVKEIDWRLRIVDMSHMAVIPLPANDVITYQLEIGHLFDAHPMQAGKFNPGLGTPPEMNTLRIYEPGRYRYENISFRNAFDVQIIIDQPTPAYTYIVECSLKIEVIEEMKLY